MWNLKTSKCTKQILDPPNTVYLVDPSYIMSHSIPLSRWFPIYGCQNPGSQMASVPPPRVLSQTGGGHVHNGRHGLMQSGNTWEYRIPWDIVLIETTKMGISLALMRYVALYKSIMGCKTNYFTLIFDGTRGINHQQDGDVPVWFCPRLPHT